MQIHWLEIQDKAISIENVIIRKKIIIVIINIWKILKSLIVS